MCYSACKFETVKYQTPTMQLSSCVVNYVTELEKHSQLRNSGVTISDDATFQNHINIIVRESEMKFEF